MHNLFLVVGNPQLFKSLKSVCVISFAFVIITRDKDGNSYSYKSRLVEIMCDRKTINWTLKLPRDAKVKLSNNHKWCLYNVRI